MSLPWPPRCWLHPLPDRHSSPSARVFAEIIAAADIARGCGVLAGVTDGAFVGVRGARALRIWASAGSLDVAATERVRFAEHRVLYRASRVVAGPRVLVLHPPRLVGNETAEYPMLVVLTERQMLIRSAFFGALACSPPGTPAAGGDLT
jgi:hypothetical protein